MSAGPNRDEKSPNLELGRLISIGPYRGQSPDRVVKIVSFNFFNFLKSVDN